MDDKPTPEEQAASAELLANMAAAAPYLAQVRKAGTDYFTALMNAPEWRIAEAPKPQDPAPEQTWNIGAPKVRYFNAAGEEVPQL